MNLQECEHCHKITGTLHPVVHPQSGARHICSGCVMDINLTKSFGDALHPTHDLTGASLELVRPAERGSP
ncbi:MAG: hypothetical protein J0L75_13640 [Spirochaetes bacterium]|nr:hypothetical protein [Spirochaetota bacterium]